MSGGSASGGAKQGKKGTGIALNAKSKLAKLKSLMARRTPSGKNGRFLKKERYAMAVKAGYSPKVLAKNKY